MAKQAGRLWMGVLDHLAEMAARGKSRRAESVTELLKKTESPPQQPKAAWKRLLHDMQVIMACKPVRVVPAVPVLPACTMATCLGKSCADLCLHLIELLLCL